MNEDKLKAIKEERARNRIPTADQEKFCAALVRGLHATDAYKEAYPVNNYKADSLRSRASALKNKPHIKRRVEELTEIVRNRAINKATYSFNDSAQNLLSIIKKAQEQIESEGLNESKARIILSYTQELNRMYGYTSNGKNGDVNNTQNNLSVVFINSDNVEE